MLGVVVVGPQRDPIIGNVAGQKVLGQVRSIDRRFILGVQQHDAAAKLLSSQRFGGSESGRSAADDDNSACSAWGSGTIGNTLAARRPLRGLLLAHKHLTGALLDRPNVQIKE